MNGIILMSWRCSQAGHPMFLTWKLRYAPLLPLVCRHDGGAQEPLKSSGEVAPVENVASSFSISEPHIQLSGWPAAAAL